MSERYLVTGVQIGILTALIGNEENERAKKFLDRIYNEQFLGHSKIDLKKDVKRIAKEFSAKKWSHQ